MSFCCLCWQGSSELLFKLFSMFKHNLTRVLGIVRLGDSAEGPPVWPWGWTELTLLSLRGITLLLSSSICILLPTIRGKAHPHFLLEFPPPILPGLSANQQFPSPRPQEVFTGCARLKRDQPE